MKKLFSKLVCTVCALATVACVGFASGCDDKETVALFDGNFQKTTLEKVKAVGAKTTAWESLEAECLKNNGGVALDGKSCGDDEDTWDGYDFTGKMLPDSATFYFSYQKGTRESLVPDGFDSLYCTTTDVYWWKNRTDEKSKYQFAGDANVVIQGMIDIEIPDLIDWEEQSAERGFVYEYYLDEADASYTKVKIVVKYSDRVDNMIFGAHDYEHAGTLIYVFDKSYKIKAASLTESEKRTFTDKVWIWDTSYTIRPWTGSIQAPDDLSAYIGE